MIGLSREAFTLLHDVLFSGQQPQRAGRPQLMPFTAQLGLYIGSTIRIKHLCIIFGIISSTCSEIINKILSLVVHEEAPLAMVKFPDEEKMENFACLINQSKPEVDDVISFMDGATLTSECTSEPIEQNAMHIDYHSDTMVNNIFAYGPNDKVFFILSTFQVAGMMGLQQQIFCHTFIT
jgi:hypothetical protein